VVGPLPSSASSHMCGGCYAVTRTLCCLWSRDRDRLRERERLPPRRRSRSRSPVGGGAGGGSRNMKRGDVLIVYGVHPHAWTMKDVFNLFCVFGNVARIRILRQEVGAGWCGVCVVCAVCAV
jgi:hypothetical protein